MSPPETRPGLDGAMRRVSRVLAWVAGAAILFGCAVPITIDVVSRFLVNRTLLESFEISGYALATCIGLGMGYTVSTKANIRVDILAARFPPALRIVLDLGAAAGLAAVAAALAYFTWGTLQQAGSMGARSMSTLQVPLVIPMGVWWIGLTWFACVAVLTPAPAVVRLVRGDHAGADRLVGSSNLADELDLIGSNRPRDPSP